MEKVEYRTSFFTSSFGTIKQLDDIKDLRNVTDWKYIIWLRISNGTFYNKFEFPPELAEVYMDNCSGVHLLGELPHTIRFVEITNSYLMDVSPLFNPNQTQIETVNLSYNQIQEFPCNLPENLIGIDLSNNAIRKLPESPCIGTNITHVNLSYNNLTDLPAWLVDLNPNVNLSLMPNKFWFNAYSSISLNKTIHDYHIHIANRFFNTGLGAKLMHTRMIANNQIERDDGNLLQPVRFRANAYYPYIPQQQNAHPGPTNNQLVGARTTAEQAQNVHNSDIQDSFSKSVGKIMANPAPQIPDYLNKIWWYYVLDGINIPGNLLFINLVKSNCQITSVVSRNGVTYAEILERVWAISEVHEHSKEIRNVLREEINAGARVCFTGKVTRLVNTLTGFVQDVQVGYSENEQINNAVITTMRRCEQNPDLVLRDEVKKVLDGLNVEETRQAIWLDALE